MSMIGTVALLLLCRRAYALPETIHHKLSSHMDLSPRPHDLAEVQLFLWRHRGDIAPFACLCAKFPPDHKSEGLRFDAKAKIEL